MSVDPLQCRMCSGKLLCVLLIQLYFYSLCHRHHKETRTWRLVHLEYPIHSGTQSCGVLVPKYLYSLFHKSCRDTQLPLLVWCIHNKILYGFQDHCLNKSFHHSSNTDILQKYWFHHFGLLCFGNAHFLCAVLAPCNLGNGNYINYIHTKIGLQFVS